MPTDSTNLPTIRSFSKDNPIRIMFVCLGNICRSPTAEGIMQHIVNKKGLGAFYEISSAGTAAYHEGEPANSKSRYVAEGHGVKLLSTAQRVHSDDFEYYDLILAMDQSNRDDLKSMGPKTKTSNKIVLFRTFDPKTIDDIDVPDPYYGGMQGFENVFEIIHRTCENFITYLENSREA